MLKIIFFVDNFKLKGRLLVSLKTIYYMFLMGYSGHSLALVYSSISMLNSMCPSVTFGNQSSWKTCEKLGKYFFLFHKNKMLSTIVVHINYRAWLHYSKTFNPAQAYNNQKLLAFHSQSGYRTLKVWTSELWCWRLPFLNHSYRLQVATNP